MAERGSSTGAEGDRSGQKPGPGQDAPRRLPADALLGGRREVIILHNADEYRLRVTSNGKLILTK
jgi:hemin uptake protein HemP